MSVFGSDAPQEDPAVKQQRLQQQAAADSALTVGIQTDLARRTRSRLQRFGFAPNNPQPNDPSVALANARAAIGRPGAGMGLLGLANRR